MRKLCLTVVLILVFFLMASIQSLARGQGAIVVFDNPSYPYRIWIWDDDQGSGLCVAMAFREDYASTGEPTLDDAVEVFLPDPARKFTPFPMPDSFSMSGEDVPVAVFAATEKEIFDAYTSGKSGKQKFLEKHLVASGFVEGHWSGKAFKAISVHAIGPVALEDGWEAILVAVGHEIYENGVFDPTLSYYKVELH